MLNVVDTDLVDLPRVSDGGNRLRGGYLGSCFEDFQEFPFVSRLLKVSVTIRRL
jgi:hypothetical protein